MKTADSAVHLCFRHVFCSIFQKTPKDIFLDRLLTSNMVWKHFFVISGGICTAGILTCFVFDLNF